MTHNMYLILGVLSVLGMVYLIFTVPKSKTVGFSDSTIFSAAKAVL
jgi:hypothetical protein